MYKVESESPHPSKLWSTNYSSRFLAGGRLSQCRHIVTPFSHSMVADLFISTHTALFHLFKELRQRHPVPWPLHLPILL